MLKDKDRWEIQLLHRAGNSIRRIRQITHRDRKTIRTVLATPSAETLDRHTPDGQIAKLRRSGRRSTLEPFREFLSGQIKQKVCTAKLLSELRSQGFNGSLRSLQRFLHFNKAKIITTTQQMKEWMHLVLQGVKTSSQFKQDVGNTLTEDEVSRQLEYVSTKC